MKMSWEGKEKVKRGSFGGKNKSSKGVVKKTMEVVVSKRSNSVHNQNPPAVTGSSKHREKRKLKGS